MKRLQLKSQFLDPLAICKDCDMGSTFVAGSDELGGGHSV